MAALGDLVVERNKDNGEQGLSEGPKKDSAKLLMAMARREFRRPVTDEEIAGYVAMTHQALADGQPLPRRYPRRLSGDALLAPFPLSIRKTPAGSTIMRSPPADYLLTGSTPDAALSALADAGKLHDPQTIRTEADRLLARDNGRTFIKTLRTVARSRLDRLHRARPEALPELRRDRASARCSTRHAFLTNMLAKNQSVSRLIDADYTYLNSRLARFYRINSIDAY